MIKSATKSTRIAPLEGQTRSSSKPIQIIPKQYTTLRNSKKACHLFSENALNTRRAKQKSSDGRQYAVNAIKVKHSSKGNIRDKPPKECEVLDSRVRAALSQSVPPTPIMRSTKSVKFDPAIVFCNGHDTTESALAQEIQFQAGLEAILRCKKSDREKLRLILHALTADNENKKTDTKDVTESSLNPHASAFQGSSSPESQFLVTGAETKFSTPLGMPNRIFHPRTVLAQDFFELKASAQGREPTCSKSPDNGKFQTHHSPDCVQSSNHTSQSSMILSTSPVMGNGRKTLQSKVQKPPILRSPSCCSTHFQIIHPITDTFDDSGPGRVALAMDPPWAHAILNNFAQKYPMTGCLDPALPLMMQSQHNADVQQVLEYIIMQKREMEVLTGFHSLNEPARREANKWDLDYRADSGV
ncbi:hypothetical protein OIDMADRAFT_49147 [Oidiodendron maius Zn]|uniref:Uncharacterized protein n=1 Tax=Oidiodendron maius (strain Zn) TaxID=913774 RepID=A0A0C3DU93_OIDMZ|nr:hypothetical protein OIDMADRAFT_49147 [Oidiodendron maius Zn]